MTPKQKSYENTANTIIKNLKKRNMMGVFFATREEALEYITSLVKEKTAVSYGGSMTLNEIGVINMLREKDIELYDRGKARTREEVTEIYRKAFTVNQYFMSTNAITLDGKLVNIDGNGNRVAALIYGPEEVIVVTGMNKVTVDEEAAVKRVQNIASPPNTVRLSMNTPCSKTGMCQQCQTDDCICCEIVTTRRSRQANRIKVVLIGEELGF